MVHESIEVESSLPLLMTERYHFAQKEEAPILLESKQRMEETLKKVATSCNVENVDGNISVHQQNNSNNSNNEQHDDVDDLSAKDLLCLAWQIAQGMVSGILLILIRRMAYLFKWTCADFLNPTFHRGTSRVSSLSDI